MAKTNICTICGKKQVKDVIFINGSDGQICSKCVVDCYNVLKEEEVANTNNDFKLMLPTELKAHLDQYIIGQDDAKKKLCTSVYNHYKAINYRKAMKDDSVEIEKSNVLLVGPTGSGKTAMIKALAKKLNLPFASTEATGLSAAGYVGFIGL